MREPVAFQVMREAGLPAPESFHIHVRRNAEYYGLFAFVEQLDDSFLEVRFACALELGDDLQKFCCFPFCNNEKKPSKPASSCIITR